jgi:RNA recognition motif-containing protein
LLILKIDCKEAIPKSADPNDSSKANADIRTKKIFVGGLPHSLTEGLNKEFKRLEQFKEYFSKFGNVVECQIMKEKETSKPRGFGFISFDTEEAVEEVMHKLKEHKLLDKWVECKKATPKIVPQKPTPPQQHSKPPKV